MARPWTTIDAFDSDEGRLELRQRGPQDFLITVGGRVLMSSSAQISELELARLGLEHIKSKKEGRVLVGGLGMGLTLHSALNELGPDTQVTVAELHSEIENWCREPLAGVNHRAVHDPRVRVHIGDVMQFLKDQPDTYDAIILDLYEGPNHARDHDPLYGNAALQLMVKRLRPKGRCAIWSEERDASFERRLSRLKLRHRVTLAGRGGRKHAIYLLDN